MGSGVVTVCQAGFWRFGKIGIVEERILLSVLELPFKHSTEALEEYGIVSLEPSDNDLNVRLCFSLLRLDFEAQCRLVGIVVVLHGVFVLKVLTPPSPTRRP